MKIGFLGGVPELIGGGGLEVQMRETAAALASMGCEVIPQHVGCEEVDVVHAFGADPSLWNHLRNWTRNVRPLVVSPVLVISSGTQRRLERVMSKVRLGASSTSSMRRDVVRRADHLVALHDGEAAVLRRWYGIEGDCISVIGNGSNASATAPEGVRREGVVVVGTVGDRKRQLELAECWQQHWPVLTVVGPLSARWRDAQRFRDLVSSKGNVRYAGRLTQSELWNLQARSLATISASVAEGESLAALDALRLGSRVIVRSGPGTSSLTARFGAGVITYGNFAELRDVLDMSASTLGGSAPPERPGTWKEISAQLVGVYEHVLIGKHRRSTLQ